MRFTKLLVAPLAAMLIAATGPAPVATSVDRVRGHVEFLASDLLEGRGTGTRGHEIAAAYVASEFRKLGLEPAGDNGSWFQQIRFRTARPAGTPSVTLTENGRPAALTSGKDFGLRPNLASSQVEVDAPLVFVGHGISAPALGVDDFAGLDVRGKVVVVLSGAPPSLPSDVAAHLGSRKDDEAAARGAAGLIEVSKSAPNGEKNGSLEYWSKPLVGWLDDEGRIGGSVAPLNAYLGVSEEVANRLFANAPRSLSTIRQEGVRGPVRGFALPLRLQVDAASEWSEMTSANVLARLPGIDPSLAQEHVGLMGHLDHLGISENAAPGADAINNGALDNAGGIATMLEAARSFVQSGSPPKRSLLFIATTAEERGLLGADYFAEHPSLPIDRLVGLVNLDMPLLLYDFTDVIAFGAEHSTISRIVSPAARSLGVSLSRDPMPEESLFVRSDHYPLVKHGVPSVFLMTGHANGGKKAWGGFLGNVYHGVKDDIAQPIDWKAAARFAELNYRIARALADAPERPRWYGDSFFGSSFAPRQAKATRQ